MRTEPHGVIFSIGDALSIDKQDLKVNTKLFIGSL